MSDVALVAPTFVRGSDSASTLVDLSEETEEFVVLDDGGAVEGMIGSHELRVALVNREALPLLQIRDVARTGVRTINRDLSLDLALERIERGPLPVTDDSGAIIGVLTRSRLTRLWRRQMERDQ